MTRRANGEGTVYADHDGRYRAVFSIPRVPGEPRRRFKVSANTKKEAVAKLKELQRRHGQGEDLTAKKPTLGEFLDEWMPRHRAKVRPSTADRDERNRRLYFQGIEAHRIDVSFKVIDRWQQQLRDEGKGARTRQMCRTLLGTALQEAVRQGYVVRNEVRLSEPVKVASPDPKWLSTAQVRALLQAAETERLGTGVAAAVFLGLRRAEVLGLSIGDLDLEAGSVFVHRSLTKHRTGDGWTLTLGETKTRQSRRRLPVPEGLAVWLRRDLAARYGTDWSAHADDPLVVNTTGTRVDPDVFSHAVTRIGKLAGLKGVHAHLLRHTAATLLLDEGVDLAVVSAILGHSDLALTAKVYAHVLDRTQREGLDVLSNLFTDDGVPGWLPSEPSTDESSSEPAA